MKFCSCRTKLIQGELFMHEKWQKPTAARRSVFINPCFWYIIWKRFSENAFRSQLGAMCRPQKKFKRFIASEKFYTFQLHIYLRETELINYYLTFLPVFYSGLFIEKLLFFVIKPFSTVTQHFIMRILLEIKRKDSWSNIAISENKISASLNLSIILKTYVVWSTKSK